MAVIGSFGPRTTIELDPDADAGRTSNGHKLPGYRVLTLTAGRTQFRITLHPDTLLRLLSTLKDHHEQSASAPGA